MNPKMPSWSPNQKFPMTGINQNAGTLTDAEKIAYMNHLLCIQGIGEECAAFVKLNGMTIRLSAKNYCDCKNDKLRKNAFGEEACSWCGLQKINIHKNTDHDFADIDQQKDRDQESAD